MQRHPAGAGSYLLQKIKRIKPILWEEGYLFLRMKKQE